MYHEQKRKNVKDIISEALIVLLKRKLYIDITVSELVNAAQVSRASFYRNYNSIDDVITHIVDDIYIGLIERLTPSMLSYRQDKLYEAGVILFQYIFEVKDSFFKIESENASYILYRLEKNMS